MIKLVYKSLFTSCHSILLLLPLLITGCATKVETVYVYKTLHCEDAVKPELQKLDANQYISSKANTAKLLANFASLNLYVDRLQQQIECYKSQSRDIANSDDEDGNKSENKSVTTTNKEAIINNKEVQ